MKNVKMNDRFCLQEDPYEDLGFLFWQIMKAWQRSKHRLLEKFGLTPSQMEIMSAVYHLTATKNEVTQIEIAQLTNIDPMTTSSVLKKLEKKQLINRRYSSIDTRARLVNLTEDGTVLILKAISEVRESTDRVFDHVDKDILKKEFKVLLSVLTQINN